VASARYARRAIKRTRRTYSVYVLPEVVAAVDALVDAGRYTNRSDAVEDALRLLVLQASLDRASTAATEAAA
jgi:Arc/MetJ-type ribon-helix-helix transcriptional regulator